MKKKKISIANPPPPPPHNFIHVNLLSRNSGSVPEIALDDENIRLFNVSEAQS